MEIKELVKKLRNCGGGTEGIKLVNEAADKIEWLQNLVDDMTNDHFVDTLDFYADRCFELEKIATDLAIESENTCKYCENDIECKGKKCEKYSEGMGGYGQDGQHFPDWKWTCEDFDFGTCSLLEDTPCNGCFENDFSGFKLKIGDKNDRNNN